MLEWIWFAGLTIVALLFVTAACVRESLRPRQDTFTTTAFYLVAAFSLLLSLILSSPVVVAPLYHWLLVTLPQRGSEINWITATFLTCVTCIAYISGVAILGELVGRLASEEWKRHAAL